VEFIRDSIFSLILRSPAQVGFKVFMLPTLLNLPINITRTGNTFLWNAQYFDQTVLNFSNFLLASSEMIMIGLKRFPVPILN